MTLRVWLWKWCQILIPIILCTAGLFVGLRLQRMKDAKGEGVSAVEVKSFPVAGGGMQWVIEFTADGVEYAVAIKKLKE